MSSTDNGDEIFEIFDEDENKVGELPRAVVHREGQLHRSVNVVLLDCPGSTRVLVQRRSDGKKVCPGLWDVSVAEHCQPGETYEDAALRGMEEELGLEKGAIVSIESVRGTNVKRQAWPDIGVVDNEFTQCFLAAKDAEVEIKIDGVEVAEAKWVEASDLVTAVLAEGADAAYTPWFIDDLTFLVNEAKVAPLVAADD